MVGEGSGRKEGGIDPFMLEGQEKNVTIILSGGQERKLLSG